MRRKPSLTLLESARFGGFGRNRAGNGFCPPRQKLPRHRRSGDSPAPWRSRRRLGDLRGYRSPSGAGNGWRRSCHWGGETPWRKAPTEPNATAGIRPDGSSQWQRLPLRAGGSFFASFSMPPVRSGRTERVRPCPRTKLKGFFLGAISGLAGASDRSNSESELVSSPDYSASARAISSFSRSLSCTG